MRLRPPSWWFRECFMVVHGLGFVADGWMCNETKVCGAVSTVRVSDFKHSLPLGLGRLHRGRSLWASLFFVRDFFGANSTAVKFVDDTEIRTGANRGGQTQTANDPREIRATGKLQTIREFGSSKCEVLLGRGNKCSSLLVCWTHLYNMQYHEKNKKGYRATPSSIMYLTSHCLFSE